MLQEEIDGNLLAYLDPSSLLSLRLSNPRHANSFDRAPRHSYDRQGTKGITTQSSGDCQSNKIFPILFFIISAVKFKTTNFRKLGRLLTGKSKIGKRPALPSFLSGDLVELQDMGELHVEVGNSGI